MKFLNYTFHSNSDVKVEFSVSPGESIKIKKKRALCMCVWLCSFYEYYFKKVCLPLSDLENNILLGKICTSCKCCTFGNGRLFFRRMYQINHLFC